MGAMRRSIRLVLAALGLGVAAHGVFQCQSTRVVSEFREEPGVRSVGEDAVRIAGGTITYKQVIEDGFLLPWQAALVVAAGLALAGYALLGRRGEPRTASG